MKRTIKIIKSFYFINTSGYKMVLPICMIATGLISMMICFNTTHMVNNYVNRGTIIDISGIVFQIVNLINLSYIFIFTTLGVSMFKGKITGSLNNFLLQAPVLKKDIYIVKFGFFQLMCIPFFIVAIYFIGLNVFISRSELVSSYSGFIALIYCIWSITVSISIGFSSLSSKKYNAIKYLFPAFMFLSIISIFYLTSFPYVQADTLVDDQNMFNGLGSIFIPILKACRHIGGISGLFVILLSIIISYFLGCKLPLKISEKVGN